MGGQPVGFDEWSALYNKYRVYECTLDLEVRSAGSFVDVAIFALGAGSGGAPATPSFDAAAVHPYSKHMKVSSAGTTGRAILHVPIHKLFGLRRHVIDYEDDFAANISANPSRTAWLSAVFSTAGTSDSVEFTWTISMKTRLNQLNVLSLSAFNASAPAPPATAVVRRMVGRGGMAATTTAVAPAAPGPVP